jgi:hypothetical protein
MHLKRRMCTFRECCLLLRDGNGNLISPTLFRFFATTFDAIIGFHALVLNVHCGTSRASISADKPLEYLRPVK